jgi:hypothetical protein
MAIHLLWSYLVYRMPDRHENVNMDPSGICGQILIRTAWKVMQTSS